ncbi:uncharacterized protein LY89DRAFT_756231 [Mollisia scopiformis]|uniref:Uncharacterized protein n=1 Tax=Mollisia scopiformis TaxID=149040 RepID=A0A194WYD3_MOLSC|nr:uncharacterized protein LY89DRAFT_756231 [Mollisia scopiformis]KUJ12973.1 hypothetical protein LY89DRAFT_756231 [Mollisia scopiformis]
MAHDPDRPAYQDLFAPASPKSPKIEIWGLRSDVLYHFYAYRVFARKHPETCLDLVNLNDADVEYYNRTRNMVHSLNNYHKLATYMKNFALKHPVEDINTHRKRFICHVREYNLLRTDPINRFYLVNLSVDEAEFLSKLSAPSFKPTSTANNKSDNGSSSLNLENKVRFADNHPAVDAKLPSVVVGSVESVSSAVNLEKGKRRYRGKPVILKDVNRGSIWQRRKFRDGVKKIHGFSQTELSEPKSDNQVPIRIDFNGPCFQRQKLRDGVKRVDDLGQTKLSEPKSGDQMPIFKNEEEIESLNNFAVPDTKPSSTAVKTGVESVHDVNSARSVEENVTASGNDLREADLNEAELVPSDEQAEVLNTLPVLTSSLSFATDTESANEATAAHDADVNENPKGDENDLGVEELALNDEEVDVSSPRVLTPNSSSVTDIESDHDNNNQNSLGSGNDLDEAELSEPELALTHEEIEALNSVPALTPDSSSLTSIESNYDNVNEDIMSGGIDLNGGELNVLELSEPEFALTREQFEALNSLPVLTPDPSSHFGIASINEAAFITSGIDESIMAAGGDLDEAELSELGFSWDDEEIEVSNSRPISISMPVLIDKESIDGGAAATADVEESIMPTGDITEGRELSEPDFAPNDDEIEVSNTLPVLNPNSSAVTRIGGAFATADGKVTTVNKRESLDNEALQKLIHSGNIEDLIRAVDILDFHEWKDEIYECQKAEAKAAEEKAAEEKTARIKAAEEQGVKGLMRGFFFPASMAHNNPLAGSLIVAKYTLGWVTDGCPDVHTRTPEVLDKEELAVDRMIEKTLREYQERLAVRRRSL